MQRYTLAEARYILSHVYCVLCLPVDDGWTYRFARGAGEALCCRCQCSEPADLWLYVASERKAAEWLERENAAVDLAVMGEAIALANVALGAGGTGK